MAAIRLPATTILALTLAAVVIRAEPPSPESFFGHPVGEDRKLASWSRVVEYLRLVDDTSERVAIEEAGKSTLGNEMLTVILTSEANQRRLEEYRDIAGRLARPQDLEPAEAGELARQGKVIVLVTCTIHSTEVGCTQMATELVHELATTEDAEKLAWMDEVILLLMPSINPDGQVLVIDWYGKHLGSEYEGGRMPWLYHHYVGHDNNRDFYMLTQVESRVVNDVLYHRWHPQVFVDEHQMGSTGPRMFVPPQTDPLAPEVHPLIFRQADLIGTNMSFRLEEAGKTGVGHNMIFDSYWPGGTRNTAWWKNVTGLLTEVASARVGTPIYVDPGELRGGSKGLPEYERRANFPSPWPGGWWRLRDIIDYELIATWALMETAAEYRSELLWNFYRMGREAVEAGRSQPPTAWIVAPEQHDPVAAGLLVELLLRHGVTVETTEEPFVLGRATYPAGTHVIPADQPFRAFLLTMLRPQRYPEVVPYEGGPVIPPYDVTSWSLPIAMGVDVLETALPLPDRLTPLTAPRWPEATVPEAAGGYRLPHAADSVYIAVNRLLARGKSLEWLTDQDGDLYLPPGEIAAAELAELATELHLPVEALEAAPEGARMPIRPARVGLYKPWVASMDEGWTRWLLERYEFPYLNLSNDDIRENSFAGKVDALLFPAVDKSIIATGEPEDPRARQYWSPLPPEYSGGIEPEGGGHLQEWVESGGTLIALDAAGDYVIDLFDLPVVNVLQGVDRATFAAPGTMLRVHVDTGHPLGFGLRPEEAVYVTGSAAYRTRLPDARFDRRVLARFPADAEDIPVSGYILGEELLERRAAAVEVEIGKGRVVLFGFRPQHRAQTHRTFKMLFNALYR